MRLLYPSLNCITRYQDITVDGYSYDITVDVDRTISVHCIKDPPIVVRSKQANAFLRAMQRKTYHMTHAHKNKISQRRLKVAQRRYETRHRNSDSCVIRDGKLVSVYRNADSSHYIINSEGQAIPLSGFTFDSSVDYKNLACGDVASFNAALTRVRNWSAEMYGTWK